MSLRVLQQNGEAAPDAGFSSDTRPKHVQNGCASCLVRHLAICAALPVEQVREMEALSGDVKLAAGDMVLYPSTSLHRVTPVTRGARVASFFWIESLVPDEGERTLLFDLDQSIQQLTPLVAADDPRLVQLTGVYHNLLRRWARP